MKIFGIVSMFALGVLMFATVAGAAALVAILIKFAIDCWRDDDD